jgi:hypothetical protein
MLSLIVFLTFTLVIPLSALLGQTLGKKYAFPSFVHKLESQDIVSSI